MSRDKKKGSSSKMLASSDQIVIKQGEDAKTRYSGNLSPESEIVIRQASDSKDNRY
ncbi:MAG: hypothetical protein ACE5GV_00345 [Candidatus Scalindua sp.]